MSNPREYIENIKQRQLNSDKEFILDSLTGAIDRLQKAFPRYGSFLMEFLQNADDAKSKSLQIEILERAVRIHNDGTAFSEEDVKSICKVGRSSKTVKDYIGYLGVGFKAVFLISDSPEIYSGGFSFRFGKNAWDEPAHTPWQVMPLWIDNPQIEPPEYGTIFNLPLKETKLLDKIRDEVTPEQLSDRMLLFLKNVKEIVVTDLNQNFKRKIVKSKISETSDYEKYRIQEYENDTSKHQEEWLLFRTLCSVPPEVKQDYVTKDWERGDVETREVLVAFRLGDSGNVTIEERGTAHIGVYSFLPLKEVPSGLNFLIQADFLTTPGRGELARESMWNNWLAQEVYNLIITRCVPTFLRNENWRMNFTQILYSIEGGHELFDVHIKRPLRAYLGSQEVLIAQDSSPAKAEELVEIEREVRELLTEKDLQILFPGKKILHEDCKLPFSLVVEKAPSDVYAFLQSYKSDELLKQKASLKDIAWFKNLYSGLVEKYSFNYFYKKFTRYNVEHDNFWDGMRNFWKPVILTEDYRLEKIGECHTNPHGLEIPAQISGKFNIVHHEIVADEGFANLTRKLNEERYNYPKPDTKVISEITEDSIRNALKKHETLELNSEKWKLLPETGKIEKIREIKDLWTKDYISLEDYDFLTIRETNGIWKEPQELFFSRVYKPEHNLDEITNEKRLCDAVLDFVDPQFVDGENEHEVEEWHRFLKELGVDRKLADRTFMRDIVQRIGILVALQFEKKKGRGDSRELTRSQEVGGYDIELLEEESEDGSGLINSPGRYIEVKSSRRPDPDIFLTAKQFSTLQDKRETYFVYVVRDALRYPTLSVTRGDRLAGIKGIKAIIPFAKWSGEAREEDFQP